MPCHSRMHRNPTSFNAFLPHQKLHTTTGVGQTTGVEQIYWRRKIKMRFLIIRTDKIGDTVLSTNVFELIGRVFPDSYTGVLIRPYTAPLVQNNPFIDKVFLDEGPKKGMRYFFRLASSLRKKKFDIALVLFSSPRVATLLKLAGIPYCVGPASKIEQFLYNKRVRQKRSRAIKHEADYNMDIAYSAISSKFGKDVLEKAREFGKNIEPKIFLTKEEIEQARYKLDKVGVKQNDRLVIVHPGSGGSAKNWPPEKYGKICDAVGKQSSAKVIVTWGPGEEDIIKQIKKLSKEKHLYFGGEKNSLRDLIALLYHGDILFTSSTGPLHIAAAVGTRTVSIFCPIRVCLPARWGPRGDDKHRVFLPDVPVCKKCLDDGCRHFNCMDSIPFESVLRAILAF